jgi:hypothetical protein
MKLGWRAGGAEKEILWEGADMSRIHFITGTKVRNGVSRDTDLSTDLEAVRRKMKELGNVKLIIVDPLSSYIGVQTKMDPHSTRCTHGASPADRLHRTRKGRSYRNYAHEQESDG